jgi:hypothetical protein
VDDGGPAELGSLDGCPPPDPLLLVPSCHIFPTLSSRNALSITLSRASVPQILQRTVRISTVIGANSWLRSLHFGQK